MTLYIAVELTRYELPLFVGTRDEVAAWAELTPSNISAYCKQGSESLKNKCRFDKIKIDNEEIR